MSYCDLHNIPHSLPFVNLTSLSTLDISNNGFQGIPISEFIVLLQNLRHLGLSYSSFNGMVPSSIGNLSNLHWVGVGNQTGNVVTLELRTLDFCKSFEEQEAAVSSKSCLGGTLNPSLLNLTYLNYLDLSRNNFEGNPIPEFIGSLKNLKYLDLSQASFTLMVPSSIGNLTDLQYLDLTMISYPKKLWASDLNLLSGSIPKIPQGNLCNLRSLDIAYTYISGEINELVESLSACNNSTLETLDLASNQLSGSLPDSLGNLIYLEYLGLSENSLLGTLPPSIGNQSHLGALYLSFNMLTGIIPENNGQLSELYVLELYGNSWEGVITENHFQNLTGTQVRLSDLTLRNDAISDTIPDWFCRLLSDIWWLDLSNNQLRGVLPKSIHVGRNPWINLGYNRLEGSFSLWSNVTNLSLRNNLLTGPIPSDIGSKMSMLNRLDLSRNLLNGSIPPSMSEMKNLSSIDLSHNNLSGEIPSNWQDLELLRVIDLSNNRLSGDIPTSVCSLPSLLWLKLNHNDLSGKLSISLRICTGLLVLDVG
ncbi:Leucine-rich repeat receptor protein kinase [Melia azedarach]|uniref:Leucine-rich repeat receptor protein kinase n=1 Tax=Melia azedarach TaxID=155640 RepID=A0ACC1XJL4_MELAZ|nr:Leucine-rich repeat receptor protein kinase [Melia azedarach]